MTNIDSWRVAGVELSSRLLLGTAGYPSPSVLGEAIAASGTQVVTVGLKRALATSAEHGQEYMAIIRRALSVQGAHLLPNTAGCRTAREAIELAHMARELYDTPWIKLEVVGDEHTLAPDGHELLAAATHLVKDGFVVWPYCTDDLINGRRLLDSGCAVLMPWGAPIGSGQGLINPTALRTLRERLRDATLIVDAGIGAPSHAARAMEIGFDAVLLNSAVSQAIDPVAMAAAFQAGVAGGRMAFRAGLMAPQDFAVPSTPVGLGAVMLGGAS